MAYDGKNLVFEIKNDNAYQSHSRYRMSYQEEVKPL